MDTVGRQTIGGKRMCDAGERSQRGPFDFTRRFDASAMRRARSNVDTPSAFLSLAALTKPKNNL
jgi:hypothetical protein